MTQELEASLGSTVSSEPVLYLPWGPAYSGQAAHLSPSEGEGHYGSVHQTPCWDKRPTPGQGFCAQQLQGTIGPRQETLSVGTC